MFCTFCSVAATPYHVPSRLNRKVKIELVRSQLWCSASYKQNNEAICWAVFVAAVSRAYLIESDVIRDNESTLATTSNEALETGVFTHTHTQTLPWNDHWSVACDFVANRSWLLPRRNDGIFSFFGTHFFIHRPKLNLDSFSCDGCTSNADRSSIHSDALIARKPNGYIEWCACVCIRIA